MSRPDEVREQIHVVSRQLGAQYRRLGELLKEVRDKEYWKEWGYDSFDTYALVELGYRERKVRYLIATVEGFERAGVTEEEAATLETAKAQAIAPVLTAENKEKWIDKAQTMKTQDLQRAVASAQGRDVTEEAPKPFSVLLFGDQRETVDQAMDLAGRVAGTDARGVMLTTMAQEFISTYSHLGMTPIEEHVDGGEPGADG